MKRILILLLLCPCFITCHLFFNEDLYTPVYGYVVRLEIRNYTDSNLIVTCNFPVAYKNFLVLEPEKYEIEPGHYSYSFKKRNKGNPRPEGLSETPLFMETISMEAPVSSYEEFVDSLSKLFPNPSLSIKIRYEKGSYVEDEEIGTIPLADCIVGYQDEYLQDQNHPRRRVAYHVTRFELFASDLIPLCKKEPDEVT